MWYVKVLVADASYHQSEALTYASSLQLKPGQIVVAPLRRKQVLGIVVGPVAKPSFAAKQLVATPDFPPLPETSRQLLDWMQAYYPAPGGLTTQLFLPSTLPKEPLVSPTFAPVDLKALPVLTADQAQAIEALQAPGLHILHGETGSGKTRVYIELAKRRLASGQSSLILTPEIGLTSQLARAFQEVFGDRVVVVHSKLTDATRRQIWSRLLQQTEPSIVIGARSALFSPLRKLGLIVVDEAHEPAYKQDQSPYYHASTVAAKLASLHSATVVLGSATPLVADYFIAAAKSRPIVRMTELAAGSKNSAATVEIVDLKNRGQFTRSPYLSATLLKTIEQALQDKAQVLLFLNRRGTARVIFCQECGWHATCPHCDLPLVYHADTHAMRCHSCSFKAASPGGCPACKNASVIFTSVGTKAIAQEAERLFPEARVMRFDTDNKKNDRLETHFENVKAGEVDIIVGTQTLAKGLDLPKLAVVGVIIADTGLFFPDFSAEERTFQLLTQVVGRIGRGHRTGHAIIQTYSPKNPLLQSALNKDWNTFYNKELAERRQFMFPPFCYILKLHCKRATSASAQRTAETLAARLRSQYPKVIVEGPAPSFHEKTQGRFTWQLIVKAKERRQLTRIIHELPSGWSYDIDPMNLL